MPMNIPFTDMLVHDLQVNAAGRWFLIGVAAVLGGIFGSFMNVVAFRLPLRMSLSRPGSRCPACQRPIRWYDNVPVLGWIWLGGRCRDCGSNISVRYPLVEAVVAGIAGLLAWRATGNWIPDVAIDGSGVFQVDIVRFSFNLLLMCTIVSAALIEFDGHVPPARLIWLPCGAGLLALVAWPSLLPEGEWIKRDGSWAGLSGMLAAVVIGVGPWLCAWLSRRRLGVAYANAALGELVLVGAFLGDRAVVVVGLVTMTIYCVVQLAARATVVGSPRHPSPLPRRGEGEIKLESCATAGRCGWAGCLAAVTLVWLLVDPNVLPESSSLLRHAVGRLFAAAAAMTLLAAVLTFTAGRRRMLIQR
jgi:prepilin signal peptidase PulO-like enzyme (type II secretory pathway)